MTVSVILRVNQLGSLEPAMLTWTNCCGENIGDGPLWDAMPTSQNASISSTVANATEEDDGDVTVSEVDWDDQTTFDVVDDISSIWDNLVPLFVHVMCIIHSC